MADLAYSPGLVRVGLTGALPKAECHGPCSCDPRSPVQYPTRPYTTKPGNATAALAPYGTRLHVFPDSSVYAYRKSCTSRIVWNHTAPDIPYTSGPHLDEGP